MHKNILGGDIKKDTFVEPGCSQKCSFRGWRGYIRTLIKLISRPSIEMNTIWEHVIKKRHHIRKKGHHNFAIQLKIKFKITTLLMVTKIGWGS